MGDVNNLTKGPVIPILLKLSFPIILTNFIQTAYGMIDMIWVGKLGSKAVASIGTASFFINLGMALFSIAIIGSGVKIAHMLGEKKESKAKEYIKAGMIISLAISVLYCIFVILFKEQLIGFFKLNDPMVERMATEYLVISMVGVIFMCFSNYYSNVFTSYGNSSVPFKVNSVGLIINIILDPILIFGVGKLEGMGVAGAAIATVVARFIVLLLFINIGRKQFKIFGDDVVLKLKKIKEILKMSFPITVQRVTFIVISIVMARIVASWGSTAIAVQKVGVQIESISYMTIGGLQGAIAAFIGQNYGAKKYLRIKEGYFKSLFLTILFGIGIMILFIVFPEPIFKIFLKETESVKMGVSYMRILGVSQVFMCVELLTVGALNGLGKTYVAPIISVIFTGLRIPIALVLSRENLFKLDGVWMSISVSSVIKGVLLVGMFIAYLRSNRELYRTKPSKTIE